MLDINITKFPVGDTNIDTFNSLHLSISRLCTSLLKHRHVYLLDRIPQLMSVFKDLLQAIIWYKSDRKKDTALSEEEINNLVQLVLKMEMLMHLIATHKVDVKRVAPFVFIFILNLMVSSKRPTTLYPKVGIN